MLKMMKNLVVEEEGQGMVEYGLIIGLVAIACVVVFTGLGSAITAKIQEIITALGGETSSINKRSRMKKIET